MILLNKNQVFISAYETGLLGLGGVRAVLIEESVDKVCEFTAVYSSHPLLM